MAKLLNQYEKPTRAHYKILDEDTILFNKPYSLSELRKMFVKSYLPEFVEKKELKKLLIKILDLASKNLKERGKNEEELLKPLYKRAENLENPAQKMIKHLNSGGEIEELIHEYGRF